MIHHLPKPAYSKSFQTHQSYCRILLGGWPQPEESKKGLLVSPPGNNPTRLDWQQLSGLSIIAKCCEPISDAALTKIATLWRQCGALDIFIIERPEKIRLVALTKATLYAVGELRNLAAVMHE